MALGRRGISPLIATVLLISFSVALGAVVMSWGETYIEEKAEFATNVREYGTGCGQAELSITVVRDAPRVCYRATEVEIYVENGPNAELSGIKAVIVGDKDVRNIDNALQRPLPASDTVPLRLPYDASIGAIQQVKLIPKMMVEQAESLCAAKTVKAEVVPPC
ncbi:hypothetical protein HY642_04780 [Candidatus Woesearchaeota archaeon]|nr:hypothetical protein [Candidatus Woesearchaeota archaeon]